MLVHPWLTTMVAAGLWVGFVGNGDEFAAGPLAARPPGAPSLAVVRVGTVILREADSWSVSPDTRLIAYAGQGPVAWDTSEVRIAPFARRVTPGHSAAHVPGIVQCIAWHPSGTRLLVCSTSGTYLLDKVGGTRWHRKRLVARWGTVCFAEDGSFAAGVRTPEVDGAFQCEILRTGHFGDRPTPVVVKAAPSVLGTPAIGDWCVPLRRGLVLITPSGYVVGATGVATPSHRVGEEGMYHLAAGRAGRIVDLAQRVKGVGPHEIMTVYDTAATMTDQGSGKQWALRWPFPAEPRAQVLQVDGRQRILVSLVSTSDRWTRIFVLRVEHTRAAGHGGRSRHL